MQRIPPPPPRLGLSGPAVRGETFRAVSYRVCRRGNTRPRRRLRAHLVRLGVSKRLGGRVALHCAYVVSLPSGRHAHKAYANGWLGGMSFLILTAPRIPWPFGVKCGCRVSLPPSGVGGASGCRLLSPPARSFDRRFIEDARAILGRAGAFAHTWCDLAAKKVGGGGSRCIVRV